MVKFSLKIKRSLRFLGHFFSFPFISIYLLILIKQSKGFYLSYESENEDFDIDKRYAYVYKQIRTFLFLTNVKIKYEDTDKLSQKVLFFVANHKSNFDPVVLLNFFRKNENLVKPIFVAKKELEKNTKVVYTAKIIDTIFLDRKNLRDALKCINAQKEKLLKNSIIVFPEGTRNRDDQFGEFKTSSLDAAFSTLTTIQPIVIFGLANIDSDKKNYLKPKDVIVKFLDPIKPKDFSSYDKEFVVNKIRAKMQEEYNVIKERNK